MLLVCSWAGNKGAFQSLTANPTASEKMSAALSAGAISWANSIKISEILRE